MASIITATTTSGLTQSADNSGVLQLASGTGNLVTVPSVTGTAMVSGNMPTFSAYQSSAQTLSSTTFTKLTFTSTDWDTTGGMYSSSRFTPTVAGYYIITGAFEIASSTTPMILRIYKNGSAFKNCSNTNPNSCTSLMASAMVYLNGSSDYVELYGWVGTGQALQTGSNLTYFQAAMIRSA